MSVKGIKYGGDYNTRNWPFLVLTTGWVAFFVLVYACAWKNYCGGW